MTWKPIETAPSNKRILVSRYPYNGEPPMDVAWFRPSRVKRSEPPWRTPGNKPLKYYPNRWTELPEPPNE